MSLLVYHPQAITLDGGAVFHGRNTDPYGRFASAMTRDLRGASQFPGVGRPCPMIAQFLERVCQWVSYGSILSSNISDH